MEFRVLGPLEVLDGDDHVDPGGRKQRTVLALLVANAGQSITTDRLIEGTYGEDAADGARHSVQTYVSNLRGRLGDIITSTGHSYKLQLDGSTIDSIEFAGLVDTARAQLERDCRAAARQLHVALDMWRGLPFQDVDGRGELDIHIAQLNELRTTALETRIDADLACGLHRELVGELEALTTEHPFRETFHSQLMLALYRSGRQAEALRAYQRIRTNLAEELGIDASGEIRQLEQQILEQSADLSLNPPTSKPAAPRPAPPDVSQPSRTPVATPTPRALHIVGSDEEPGDIAPVIFMPRSDEAPDTIADEPGTATLGPVAPLTPARRRTITRPTVIVGLVGLAAILGAVVYANLSDDPGTPVVDSSLAATTAVVPIPAPTSVAPPAPVATTQPPPDPTSATHQPGVERTILVGEGPQRMLADESALWITLTGESKVARMDPATRVVQSVAVGDNPTLPLDHNGRLWVPSRDGGFLVVVDKESMQVVKRLRLGERLDTPVFAAGLVWVTARADFKIMAIDPETFETMETIDLPGFPLTPVFADGGLWVVGRDSGTVTRIDPFTFIDTETVLPLGRDPHPPLVVGREIWIVNRTDGTATIIDPLIREEAATLQIGGTLSPPLLAEGKLWISDADDQSLVVVDTGRRQVLPRFATGLKTTKPAGHEGAIWASDPSAGFVVRVDPVTRETQKIRVDGTPGIPLSAHGFVWVPDMSGTTVTKILD